MVKSIFIQPVYLGLKDFERLNQNFIQPTWVGSKRLVWLNEFLFNELGGFWWA